MFARDVGATFEGLGSRTDAPLSAGEVGDDANDRRAFADDRWAGSNLDTLHAAGAGATAVAGEVEIEIAGTTATENHRQTTREPLSWCSADL